MASLPECCSLWVQSVCSPHGSHFVQIGLEQNFMLAFPFQCLCVCWRGACKASSVTGHIMASPEGRHYFWTSSSLEELRKKVLTMHGSLKGFSLADGTPRTPQRIVIELFFILLNTLKTDVPIMWKHFENLFETCCLIKWWWETHSGREVRTCTTSFEL